MIKIVLVFCAALFFTGTVILESYQTHISSPVITSDKINYKQGDSIIISGWVSYNEEPTSDVLLKIIATNPQEVKIFEEYTTSNPDGTFAIEIPISASADVGNYSIEVISQCREIHREICTHQYESLTINVDSKSEENKIPDWVKNMFVWYGEGTIGDKELLNAIEFLINQNIIQVENNKS